jgi:PAS domain S-box-containing protein
MLRTSERPLNTPIRGWRGLALTLAGGWLITIIAFVVYATVVSGWPARMAAALVTAIALAVAWRYRTRFIAVVSRAEHARGAQSQEQTHHSDLHLALDSLPGLVHTMTPAGGVEFVNRQVLEFFGKQPADLIDWGPVVHPDDRERVVGSWTHSVKTGDAFDEEHRVLRADGVYRWFHSRGTALRDQSGQIVRWLNLLTDIEDRKQAEEASRANEARFRTMIDNLPGLVSTRTADGAAEFINRQLVEFFGEEIRGLPDWSRFLHPEDYNRVVDEWRDARRQQTMYEVEFRARRSDGSYRWLHSRVSPLFDTGGTLMRWYNLIIDVHDRKVAEEALRDSEQKLRLILDTIPGLVNTFTPTGELESVNQQVLEYFGRSFEELRNPELIVHPDDFPMAIGAVAHSLQTGEPLEVEARALRADGVYRWFQVRAQPLRGADGNVIRWYHLLTDVDDRRKAEDALRSSERNLRLIFDTLPGLITAMTPAGELESVNKPVLDFFNRSFEELKNFADVTHPDDLEAVATRLRHSLETGDMFEVEARALRADGVYRWFFVRARPLRDSDGRIVRWYHLLTDIDDLKRAEQAVRDSENNFRLIIDNIPGMAFTRTAAGAPEFINKQLREYHGPILDGLPEWSSLVHPEDRERIVATWQNALRTGQDVEFEMRTRRPDGTYRWLMGRGRPSFDSKGALLRWYCLLTDIDDRKRAEEAVRSSEHRLRILADTIPGLVITFTPDGVLESVNRQALDYFGLPLEELRNWKAITHPDDYEIAKERLRRSLETGEPFETEARNLRADGVYRWFHTRGLPLRDNDGQVVRWYFLITDVDDRKRAEQALRESEANFRLIVDNIPGMVATRSADGSPEFINQRMLDFYGESIRSMPNWAPLIHPEDRDAIVEQWRLARQTGAPQENEHRSRRPDGTYRWLKARNSPSFDENGKLVRWYMLLVDIDDRKKAEEALRSSEQSLRILSDTIPGLVITFTPTGELESVNRKVLRDWAAVTHPDDYAFTVERLRHSLETGEPFETESRALRADGQYRWFHTRGLPLRDASGAIVRWYYLLTDYDDRKRAEHMIRESEKRFREAIDNIPGFIHTMTPTGEIEFVNKQIVDFFGKPLDELKDWTKVTHPDDMPEAMTSLRHSLATGEIFDSETRGLSKDGTYRWFHSRAQPVRDDSGQIQRWYHLITDIDDRKRAEQALRVSELNFRRMADTISGLICTNTATGAVELVNQTILDYTGKTSEELKDWPSVVFEDDLPHVAAKWTHSVATGEPFDTEVRVRRADGAYRWFQCRGRPLYGDGGEILRWYNLLTDIEDRKTAEEALRTAQARLAKAIQIATIGELSASIAHEVNQPLAAVVANGHACDSWLAAAPPNIERARAAAERVIRDGNSAAEVVQRIRALFRKAQPLKLSLNVNEMIEEVCRLVGEEATNRGIRLDMQLQPDLPPIMADRIQMQQLMANLIRNSIDAMVEAAHRSESVQISTRIVDHEILLEVRDFGVGLLPGVNVFEPFVTTKQNGMGMGLSVCRSIVESHGGRLWAEPTVPNGATFIVALPVTEMVTS